MCLAQDTVVPAAAAPADVNEAGLPPVPYVAQITGNNVYIRCGPGTEKYTCGQLNRGDKVTVVGRQFGWSRIVPPAGSFSWVPSQYVRTDANNPGTGIVTGNAVPVYIGAPDRQLIHCTEVDLKLNRGEKVKLLGARQDNYYKIAPSAGAYRWVSTAYTEPLSTVVTIPPPVMPPPTTIYVPVPTDVNTDANTGGEAVVPTSLSEEARKLNGYYAVEKQIQAERAKPIQEQDFTDVRKALLAIAADEEAGKAARYAQFALKQIDRWELAAKVDKVVQQQDAQLDEVRKDIIKAKVKRVAEIEDLGRFAVIGTLRTFTTYGAGHYRIVDDSNRTLCYALPASEADFSGFLGKKVGLVGRIEPHKQTAGAMVQFTQIVELQ
jgi:uncharacterized protein YgiM (DUF1202 family)